MKRIIAVFAIVLGLSGLGAAFAPSASADGCPAGMEERIWPHGGFSICLRWVG